MTLKLPNTYTRLRDRHPKIAEAYDLLGQACADAGPLESRARSLVKLGIAIGARHEGAVHAHTRKALEEGLTPDEIRHAALLALTTIGFPNAAAATSWVEDVLEQHAASARKP